MTDNKKVPYQIMAERMLNPDTMRFSIYRRIGEDEVPLKLHGFRYIISSDSVLQPAIHYGRATAIIVQLPKNFMAGVKRRAKLAYYRRFHDSSIDNISDTISDSLDSTEVV